MDELNQDTQNTDNKANAFLNILKSIDNESALKEMLKSFEMFMEIAKQTRDMTETEIENLRVMFNEAINEARNNNSEQFATLKARILSALEEKTKDIKEKNAKQIIKLETRVQLLEEEERLDKDEIINETLSKIPPQEKLEPETSDSIKEKLLQTGIEIEDVNKLPERLKELESRGQVRVGGGSKGIQLYVEGVKKGLAQYIDIVAGSNVTVSDNVVNGLHTITIASTGGSGFTQLSATETPDGSRTQFTFATATAQPSFIVMDNVWMKPTTATGGINWTWNNGTKVATMSVPAVDDIWAVAS